jgi:hypothetical protein
MQKADLCGTCGHYFEFHYTTYSGNRMGCSQQSHRPDYSSSLGNFNGVTLSTTVCSCGGFTARLKLDQRGVPVQ